MQKIRWFILILCIITTLVLVAQNNDSASVKFLMLEQTLPLSVMLLSAGGIGFLLGALTTASMLRRRRKTEKHKQDKTAAGSTQSGSSPESTLKKTDTASATPLA